MLRRLGILGSASVLLVTALGAPAHAVTKIPFDVPVVIGGFSDERDGIVQDTGLIGACFGSERCTGIGVRAGFDDARVSFGDTVVILRGAICIFDATSPCQEEPGGPPFTGVKFTEIDAHGPSGWLDPPFPVLRACVWLDAPQDEPTSCEPTVKGPSAIEVDEADIGSLIPSAIGF